LELLAQHLGGVFGRRRIYGQGSRALEPGDHPEARMKLPVPVEGLIQPLTCGRGVQEQVVRRVTQGVQGAERALHGGPARADGLVRQGGEVGGVLARDEHHLEGRPRGRGGEDDERLVGEDQPLSGLFLRSRQPAPHAAAGLDHVTRPAADLLSHPVGDLRNGVQLDVEMLAAGSRLPPVALHCLHVQR
jgi:hypothetical protein